MKNVEKSIWFVGWKDKEGKYNEIKVVQSQLETESMQSLIKYVVKNYGQYAWDNMIYLQNIELVDEGNGYYEMFASDPNGIYPGTKGKLLLVDENRNMIKQC